MGQAFRDVELDPPSRASAALSRGEAFTLISSSGDRVVVGVGAETVEFLGEWLRDNCPCERCRVVQTDERRHQPWTASAEIDAAEVVAGELAVRFVDGHRSEFGVGTFVGLARAASRGRRQVRLWSSGYELHSVDRATLVADAVTRREFFEAFRRDGAAVVTNAPTEPGSVLALLADLQLTVEDSSLGLIFDVVVDPAGYNIASTAEAVPPHNDNAQYQHRPSGQVLAMLVNEATGGRSVVVDGWSALDRLNALDPQAVDVLCRVAIGFRQYSHAAEGFTRMPVVERDAQGAFTQLRFSNQLRQPLAPDDPDLAAWYRAYRQLGALVADPAQQVSFRLAGGDCLFVDGSRILHGRDAFAADGPRHLQDVYFNVDDVVGHLAVMTGDAVNAMGQAAR